MRTFIAPFPVVSESGNIFDKLLSVIMYMRCDAATVGTDMFVHFNINNDKIVI